MFRLLTSNDTARLADALGQRLRESGGNPLLPQRVLVPQVGLKRWLEVYLAEQNGVVANITFTPPAQFTWELLRAARPELPEHSPFEVEVLRWHLYALLGESLDGTALAPLRDYLAGDGDPLRRFALSFELARVYERMQGYRREKLLQWERGDDAGDWQAELWRRLLPRVGGVSRAARVDDWRRRFDPEYPSGEFSDKPAPPGLPSAFACFACANISPDVLRMLAVAGQHVDVDFYLPLPSGAYLGDTPTSRSAVRQQLLDKQTGNPLIVSQGGALAEFVELLYGYQHVQPDDEIDLFDADIERTTLLGRVRGDILQHVAAGDDRRNTLPDDSLQFHACHTSLREVQTLHDALLAMFDADASLQPRDVAVMMPDVTSYRAAIEAVFGGNDAQRIPFNLGDVGAAAAHPVVQLFLDLLDAPTSRWEVDELTDVLAAPGVMRRFDLDADAVERLSRRLRAAGVRWGEDEAARAECGGYREFSWAFGIDRILAGFACGDVDDVLLGDTAPLAGVEGAAFAHLDAALAVTETWRHLGDLSRRAYPAAEWQRRLNGILDSLYQPNPQDTAEVRALERIRGALERLAHASGRADPTLELPWPDLRACLRDALANPDPHQRLFTGGVTFCGMVPLRVVPFRVICLLGMHEDAFPRRARGGLDPLLADRRAGKPERGDRDVRGDDRLLFLQLLCAARDAFYVSWVGRDAHSNEDRPPSMVVAELIDVLKQNYLLQPMDKDAQAARDACLPRVEPLHPFDARLFVAESPCSYASAWLPAAASPVRSAEGMPRFVPHVLPVAPAATTEIVLDDLKRFLGDPARGFLEHALQLMLPHDAEDDAGLEPLQPNQPLLRYQLASTLLTRGDADAAHTRDLLRAQGQLPPGALADAALAIAYERVEILREAIDDFTQGTPALNDVSGSLELDDGITLTGKVGSVYTLGLLRETAGRLNGKRALHAWIDCLFATAITDAPMLCRLVWIGQKNKVEQRDMQADDPAVARATLHRLVAGMQAGLAEPLALFPQTSWEALKGTRQKGQSDKAEFLYEFSKSADKADQDNNDHGRSDFSAPAVRMAWRGVDLASPDAILANALYQRAHSLFPELQKVPKR